MPRGRPVSNRSPNRTGNTGPTVIGRTADEGADFTVPSGALSATDPAGSYQASLSQGGGGGGQESGGGTTPMTLEQANQLLNTTGVDPTSPELLKANAMIVADRQSRRGGSASAGGIPKTGTGGPAGGGFPGVGDSTQTGTGQFS